MSNIKNGKLPLSRKPGPSPVNYEDIFDNALSVDPKLIELLKAKGFSIRFINAKRYSDMGGSHPARWRPISMKELRSLGYDTMSIIDFKDGSDPDGFIRRAELVLAVRPTDLNEKHKAYLRQEAERARVKNLSKTHADEARQRFGGKGSGIQVHDGYQHDYVEESEEQD
jgi:hypothetical protein